MRSDLRLDRTSKERMPNVKSWIGRPHEAHGDLQ
jgi:hypothetical protein